MSDTNKKTEGRRCPRREWLNDRGGERGQIGGHSIDDADAKKRGRLFHRAHNEKGGVDQHKQQQGFGNKEGGEPTN